MKIYSIYDQEFKEYGEVVKGDFSDLLKVLETKECPLNGTIYTPSDKDLESCPSFEYLKKTYAGDMPIQLGFCNGHNNSLNCLEYHRDSELNLANENFILLLGKRSEIINGVFDTSKVKAFLVPAKVAVEVYATSLHYAPCGENNNGFRVLVCLPKGTNVNNIKDDNDPLLFATNKWLLAHKDALEAKKGAYIGLVGENIKI